MTEGTPKPTLRPRQRPLEPCDRGEGPVRHPGPVPAGRTATTARAQARRNVRRVRPLRRRAAGRPRRARALPRGDAVPVAAGTAARRRAADVPQLEGEQRRRTAHRRRSTNRTSGRTRRVAACRGARSTCSARKLLWHGICYERLRVHNYGEAPVEIELRCTSRPTTRTSSRCAASTRARAAELSPDGVASRRGDAGLQGLDGVVRRTRLAFAPAPTQLSRTRSHVPVSCRRRRERDFFLSVVCERGEAAGRLSLRGARRRAGRPSARGTGGRVRRDSNEPVQRLARRRIADLAMMTTADADGPYPYAGVPWFSTPFGRDGIITALECLWVDPKLARGVLAFPGRHPGDERPGARRRARQDPARDARRRDGRARRDPFRPLLRQRRRDAALRRARRRVLRAHRRPGVHRASSGRTSARRSSWIDRYGDLDGDGFVEYPRADRRRPGPPGLEGLPGLGLPRRRRAGRGADRAVRGAGLRVRGAGGRGAARGRAGRDRARQSCCASAGGPAARASTTRSGARSSAPTSWRSTATKRPCRVRTSNAGHVLFTGIARASARAARRADAARREAPSRAGASARSPPARPATTRCRYHNGSVWPHDNALIAMGLARYGLKREALRI